MTIKHTNPLHLYRALLRETTYLFDPNVRSWTQEHVKSSFRGSTTSIQDSKRGKALPHAPDYTPSLHERHQLKRGRQFLILLQRANQGYPRSLRTIVQLAYGRRGRQKRILTAQLLKDGPQHVNPADGALNDNEQGLRSSLDQSPAKFSKDWKAPRALLSLLETQHRLNSYLMIKSGIKLAPQIDEKNKWGRPMPLSRDRNITKKWYAKMAKVVMPPISESEWQRLKAIALGQHELRIIPRRAAATRVFHNEKIEGADMTANTMVSGFDKEGGMRQHISVNNPHNITHRFLSRFYAKHVLNHSPMVAPDPRGDGIVSKWDNGVRMVSKVEKPKGQTQIDALFG